MLLLLALSFPLVSTVLPLVASVTACNYNAAVRASGLERRAFDNARLTWYDITTGETACGGKYSESDYVVALNSQQYGSGYPGPNCGRRILITVNGQSAEATIVDQCPECPYGGLDLTKGLFSMFASTDVGVLSGSWDFI